MANEQSFLVLDGHSLAYRAFHALPVENFQTSSGQHTNAVYGFMSMLVTVLKERKPTHIAVAFDISRETFRSQQYPEYKATRAKSPEEFKGQVELIKQILEALNIQVVTAPNFEADDILATLAKTSTIPVSIVSGDRDSFQLVASDVSVLYPRKGMTDLVNMTDEAIQEKYGVSSNRYRDLAALVGESSDNLPGVPGVGPKTAAKWINEYGSLEEILATKETIAGKVGEALREHSEQVALNYELNRLIDNIDIPTDVLVYAKRSYDISQVHRLFDELEFSALRPRLFQAWPTENSSSSHTDEISSQDAPAGEVPAEQNVASTLVVSTTQVSEAELKNWLEARKDDSLAVSFAGSWGRGTGTISHAAWVAGNGDSVWAQWASVQKVAAQWCASQSPKIIHDAKGPALALLAEGVVLAGLVHDTAVAAYLASPGTRSFALSDLVQRYLHTTLELPEQAKDAGTLFAAEVSGDLLALQARATLDLSDVLGRELADRGATALMADIELPLILVLAQMEAAGIAVDVVGLKKLETSFDDDANAAVKLAHTTVGHEFNLGSPKQLQEVLFEERGLPKTKKIKTGYTTDAEALQSLLVKVPDDDLLIAILRYREVSKLRQTVTGLLSCVADDARIHTSFNQLIAATGRLSSTDPNLQNIPIRTEEGGRIRDAFVVGEGFETLITADYSQIEMRVMAHLSQDDALIAALNSGEDLHTTVGSQVFGVAPTEVTPEMRRQIKAMSYGLAYGLSAFGLAQQLGISNESARGLMNTYFERFGEVRDYLSSVVAQARKVGYTESILGRRRYLPDLNSDNRQLRDMAERMALNAPIQGSAADIVKVAMLKVHVELKNAKVKSRLLLQVHDELIVEVAPGEVEQVSDIMRSAMENAVTLAVPLDVSVGIGRSWTEAAH
ncbi:MAG: DNA polymerase I [Actinobacteria bacterium]|uniref:Unannotated protein n=1 Tax=freshwater metagenome TaxID=449393 RepID=A0A6J5Z082_9ZZZZ|nr:DNA polymerase I [Actinomycetota bacterium]